MEVKKKIKCDILVVGGGNAGLVAAIEAKNNVAMRLSDGLADKRLTEIYVNQSLETVRWMKEQGLQWDVSLRHVFRDGDRLIWPTGSIFLTSLGNSGEGLVEQLYSI